MPSRTFRLQVSSRRVGLPFQELHADKCQTPFEIGQHVTAGFGPRVFGIELEFDRVPLVGVVVLDFPLFHVVGQGKVAVGIPLDLDPKLLQAVEKRHHRHVKLGVEYHSETAGTVEWKDLVVGQNLYSMVVAAKSLKTCLLLRTARTCD